jgi:hypothetical protein
MAPAGLEVPAPAAFLVCTGAYLGPRAAPAAFGAVLVLSVNHGVSLIDDACCDPEGLDRRREALCLGARCTCAFGVPGPLQGQQGTGRGGRASYGPAPLPQGVISQQGGVHCAARPPAARSGAEQPCGSRPGNSNNRLVRDCDRYAVAWAGEGRSTQWPLERCARWNAPKGTAPGLMNLLRLSLLYTVQKS